MDSARIFYGLHPSGALALYARTHLKALVPPLVIQLQPPPEGVGIQTQHCFADGGVIPSDLSQAQAVALGFGGELDSHLEHQHCGLVGQSASAGTCGATMTYWLASALVRTGGRPLGFDERRGI